jgi:hypothetical protein
MQVDGRVITATATASPTILPGGVQTWPRAGNTAGLSGWAAPYTLEVRRCHVYLPPVVKSAMYWSATIPD